METVETDGTVVAAGTAGTSESVEVMVDEPEPTPQRDPAPDAEAERDSAASADGRYQRP
jgi:hypothetical protein